MQAQHIIRDIVVSNPIIDISARRSSLHPPLSVPSARPPSGSRLQLPSFSLYFWKQPIFTIPVPSWYSAIHWWHSPMKINCFWNNCYQMAGLSTAGLHAPSANMQSPACSSVSPTPRKNVFGQQFPAGGPATERSCTVLATHGRDPRTDGQEKS